MPVLLLTAKWLFVPGVVLMCRRIEDLGEPWGRRYAGEPALWLASASGERQARPKAGSPVQGRRPHGCLARNWRSYGLGQKPLCATGLVPGSLVDHVHERLAP